MNEYRCSKCDKLLFKHKDVKAEDMFGVAVIETKCGKCGKIEIAVIPTTTTKCCK